LAGIVKTGTGMKEHYYVSDKSSYLNNKLQALLKTFDCLVNFTKIIVKEVHRPIRNSKPQNCLFVRAQKLIT